MVWRGRRIGRAARFSPWTFAGSSPVRASMERNPRAFGALAALRFRMLPDLSEDMKEEAYQQVRAALEAADRVAEEIERSTNHGTQSTVYGWARILREGLDGKRQEIA